MSFVEKIKQFYNEKVTTLDKIYFLAMGITLLLGVIYLLVNQLFFHYSGIFYVPSLWLALSPFVLGLLLLGMATRKISPRMGYFTRSYSIYFFIVLALGILTTGMQYTPFPLIDHALAKADMLMGFHSLKVLNWTYAHPHVKHFLSLMYDMVGYQLFVIPLMLAFWLDKKAVEIFLLSIIASYLIGTTIYYFFPTAGLTAVFSSPHFLPGEHETFKKFYDVHHHIPFSFTGGGMIAFPSFHVAWAVLLTYACRHKKWILYPLIVVNIAIIVSTFMLGWHYLIDVFGGLLLAVIAIVIADRIYQRYHCVT